MYLFLTFFWMFVAVVLQVYWDTLKEHAYLPIERNTASLICFVLFSYNFIRWRMACTRQRTEEAASPPAPRPRRGEQEYHPEFDFSDPKPDDGKKPSA